MSRLGPDPLRPEPDPDIAWRKIARSGKSIAELLMDQSVLAGIGNVYRSEVLFRQQGRPVPTGQPDPPHDVGRDLARPRRPAATGGGDRQDRHCRGAGGRGPRRGRCGPGGPADGADVLRLQASGRAMSRLRVEGPHPGRGRAQPVLVRPLPTPSLRPAPGRRLLPLAPSGPRPAAPRAGRPTPLGGRWRPRTPAVGRRMGRCPGGSPPRISGGARLCGGRLRLAVPRPARPPPLVQHALVRKQGQGRRPRGMPADGQAGLTARGRQPCPTSRASLSEGNSVAQLDGHGHHGGRTRVGQQQTWRATLGPARRPHPVCPHPAQAGQASRCLRHLRGSTPREATSTGHSAVRALRPRVSSCPRTDCCPPTSSRQDAWCDN